MPAALEVPALPIAYVRALQLLREPDAEIDQLVRVGNDDPAFAAALIRLANSAESSPLSRVRTIRGAVVRLGIPEARRTIVGVTLKKAFRGVGGSHNELATTTVPPTTFPVFVTQFCSFIPEEQQ
ncbi:MAG: HDOD domain-containing protein, partial [Dehalococcoidia bacterium]|nr:HDOD domain-containing protein [Dehalococcoidia bacterium]